MILLVSIILELILIGSIFATSDPRVQIKNGTLEGSFMKSRKGREFAAYIGIPYALPPLGDLRFEVSIKIKILIFNLLSVVIQNQRSY